MRIKFANDDVDDIHMKKKRATLTIIEKIEIIKMLDNGKPARKLCKSLGIGVSTIYTIKKDKDKILKFYANSDSNKDICNRTKMTEARFVELDKILYNWFKKCRKNGLHISGPRICEKAKQFHKELKINEPCKFSSGWLHSFKLRHGIQHLRTRNEVSRDEEVAENFCFEISELIKKEKLTPEQIYNVDATPFFWGRLPRHIQAEHPNGRESQKKVTYLTCSNMAGTHKCKLLVINNSILPHSLKGVATLPVHYMCSKRANLTEELMTQWFENHFIVEAREHCQKVGLYENSKIVLILNNCSVTFNADVLSSWNVYATSIPPNCAPLIQPMDMGIIISLKSFYQQEFISVLQKSCNKDTGLETFKKKFNIKDCIWILASAWKSIPQDVLYNAWYKLRPIKEEK